MPAITPEPIMKVAMGFMASKHLFGASEIGLFEALSSGAASLHELSSRIGVPARTLGIVTAAMVSLGLVEQDGNLYRNSDAAAAFLAGNLGRDLRPMLRYFDKILWQNWEDLAEAVRTDQGQPRFGKFTREQQQIFSDGVDHDSRSNGGCSILRFRPPSFDPRCGRRHGLIPCPRAAAK